VISDRYIWARAATGRSCAYLRTVPKRSESTFRQLAARRRHVTADELAAAAACCSEFIGSVRLTVATVTTHRVPGWCGSLPCCP
jgi:hypothetical protein